MEQDQEGIIEELFDEVQQELQQQLTLYQQDIHERLILEVPTKDQEALSAFVAERKQYYKTHLANEWGEPPAQPLTLENYRQLVADQIENPSFQQEIARPSLRRDLILEHAQRYLYAELMQYLNSLIYEPSSVPDWQEKKHHITLRFSKDQQRAKEDAVTTLSLRQTIAFYEIAAQFGVFLTLQQEQTLSAIAMSMCLASGYSKESIEKEMSQVSAEDYRIAHQKFKAITQQYAPPQD